MIKKLNWIPNLFTLGNLSLGFIAVILSANSFGMSKGAAYASLSLAGGLILLAMMLDGLDGYAARLLNARSDLGAQLDSLADLTTFGIAPGVVMYALVLKDLNISIDSSSSVIPVGMFIAVIWPATAAYRLARFNVSHSEDSFTGLPSPIAGLIVGLMPVIHKEGIGIHNFVFIVFYVIVAFLMVSTLKFTKPQVTLFRKFSPVRMGAVLMFLLAGLILLGFRFGMGYAAVALLIILSVYVASGIVSFIIHAIQELRM
ncbi:MAG: CDP-alcohol phosphatidyltransferase family protein [Spirochaetia bacterium]|nr:CDP-alcohol phosphatidyltransferase family protein [Spirochaetia bacterium]